MFEIDDVLKKIEYNTDRIAVILAEDGRLDIEQVNNLSKLYGNREILLKDLEVWYKTDEAKLYFAKNKKEFDKRIKLITEKDKKHLDNIESRAKELKSKLKEMRKQKSVLLYAKES
ncbi:MAG: hypothetical protein EPN82_11065 [Bacteroidetes bacterium]|nr:MAG: hypothetical protein EPN82_11065 [Bacteroidota bacterium]